MHDAVLQKVKYRMLCAPGSMTEINTKGVNFLQPVGRVSKRGFGGSVGVSDGGGDAVLAPADAFAVDRVFEAVLVRPLNTERERCTAAFFASGKRAPALNA